MQNYATRHGNDKIRKRLGVDKKKTEERAREALENGMPREVLSGRLRRYVDRQYFKGDKTKQFLIFIHFLWIFSKGKSPVLITCYPIPGHLTRDVENHLKRYRKA